jgi:hypothetical protein
MLFDSITINKLNISDLNKSFKILNTKKTNITCLEFIQKMPKQEMPKQEMPKQEMPKQEMPKQEMPKQEMPKQKMPKQKQNSISFEVVEKNRIKHEKRLVRMEKRKVKKDAKKAINVEKNKPKINADCILIPKPKKPISDEVAEKTRIKHEKRQLRIVAKKVKRDAKKLIVAAENQQKMKAGISLNQKKPKNRWNNVKKNICDIDSCLLEAVCGLSYKKAVRCPGHRTPLMYYVLNTNCVEKGCPKKAAYGKNYWARVCLDHKETEMMYCMKAHRSAVSEQMKSKNDGSNILNTFVSNL